MTTYYVHGQTGSDANSGLSSLLAKQSLSGLVGTLVTGDTVNCGERLYDNATFGSLSNVTIQQEPGYTQAIFDGSSILGQSGWIAATNAWTKSIGTSLGVEYCIYGTSTNARGSFTRHLTSDTAVNVAAATGATGKYNYNSGTGLLTVYLGGDNPNSSGKAVAYIARNNNNCIYVNTGDGNVFRSLYFENWQNNAQGGCLYLEGQTNLRVDGCKSWDCGPHAFVILGQGSAISNCALSDCYSYGCDDGGSHFTYYQAAAGGNTSNLRFVNCHVERHIYLNIDGAPIAGLSGAQTGWLCHSDSGTPCRDIEAIGCSSYDQDVQNAPIVEWQSNPAPADGTIWSSYSCRSQNGIYENMTRWQISNHQSMRSSVMNFQQSGSSGLCRYGGFGCVSLNLAAGRLLMEGCAIRFRSDDGSSSPCNITMLANATCIMRFINCSIIDDGTNASTGMIMFYFISGSDDTANIVVNGCIVGHATLTGGTQQLCYSEGSTTPAFVLDDNVYGIFQNYANVGNVAIANAAALAAKDTHSKILSSNPFTNYVTDLKIIQGTVLYGYKRQTGSPVPTECIDGAYAGFPGAYQGVMASIRSRDGDANRLFWRSR